ncbi:MAG TPA: hypothetical protein VLZ83_06810 [Edaphocola sp.]|nr:hypothetical protein [Edaphocola sp.]
MKKLSIIFLLGVMALLFGLNSCFKTKCYSLANGSSFSLYIEERDSTFRLPEFILDSKFYYYLNDGRVDTLEFGHLDGNPNINGFFSTLLPKSYQFYVTIRDDLPPMSSLSFRYLTLHTLNNNIKDGYLYIKFPDGITDSLRILVRNKEGCPLESFNYYFDGLEYNGKLAEYAFKNNPPKPIKPIKYGNNQFFRVKIHE